MAKLAKLATSWPRLGHSTALSGDLDTCLPSPSPQVDKLSLTAVFIGTSRMSTRCLPLDKSDKSDIGADMGIATGEEGSRREAIAPARRRGRAKASRDGEAEPEYYINECAGTQE